MTPSPHKAFQALPAQPVSGGTPCQAAVMLPTSAFQVRSFFCSGSPFLPALGEELRCLDGFEFVRARVRQASCADDPFLCDITPLGVPIEPTSAFELRQGGRMNQAALRLRMAIRTVEPMLAAVRHRAMAVPEPTSRLAHVPPFGRGKQTRKGARTRIPGKSMKPLDTTGNLPHLRDCAADQPGPNGSTDPANLSDRKNSRLPRPPRGLASSLGGSGRKSAPSRLSAEVSMASEHEAGTGTQSMDHLATSPGFASLDSPVAAATNKAVTVDGGPEQRAEEADNAPQGPGGQTTNRFVPVHDHSHEQHSSEFDSTSAEQVLQVRNPFMLISSEITDNPLQNPSLYGLLQFPVLSPYAL